MMLSPSWAAEPRVSRAQTCRRWCRTRSLRPYTTYCTIAIRQRDQAATRAPQAIRAGGHATDDVGNHQEAGGGGRGSSSSSDEVVTGWKHLFRALEETRASISVEERRRLERIYREFVVGRSGEMRDGQGSMEIGGRSSLM